MVRLVPIDLGSLTHEKKRLFYVTVQPWKSGMQVSLSEGYAKADSFGFLAVIVVMVSVNVLVQA